MQMQRIAWKKGIEYVKSVKKELLLRKIYDVAGK